MGVLFAFEYYSSLQLFWLLSTLCIFLFGSFVLLFPTVSPPLNDLLKYGKSQSTLRSRYHRWIEVPKRWFTHFYILATVTASIAAVLTIQCYLLEIPPPVFLQHFLTRLRGPLKVAPLVSEESAMLTTQLLWLHVVRRLLESLFTSVYSDTKMNVMHYTLGLMHYLSLPCAVLVEAPGFVSANGNFKWKKVDVGTVFDLKWNHLSVLQLTGILLFALSNYGQHQSLDVLAKMRRNYLGNITNYAHGIPTSGWFELVSCPHFMFEILIYLSLWCVMGPLARVWPSVCLFVVVNQFIAAQITHNWYKEKFGEMYPKHRRAVIPYLL